METPSALPVLCEGNPHSYSNADRGCFLYCYHDRAVEQTVRLSVIWRQNGFPPVSITPGLEAIHNGMAKPANVENPKTKRLRDEFRSTNCRLETPTAVIIPVTNTTQYFNPSTSIMNLGWRSLSQFPPFHCFSQKVSHSYLTGVPATQLRWHLPNMNAIQRT